jgi:hypothetical protein
LRKELKDAEHKIEQLPEIRELLVQKFADELKTCVEVFGSHATKWA